MARSPRSSPERAAGGRSLLRPALLLAAALLAAAPAFPARPARPDSVAADKARAILADPRFQTELPRHEELKPEDDGRSFDWRLPGGSLPAPPVPALGAGAALFRVVFYAVLVVVAVLLLAWVAQIALRSWRGRRAGDDAVPGEGPAAGGPGAPEDPTLAEAARLAAEGLYGEAIHALLLAAIHHFAARAHMPVQPSRTSRELARQLPLKGDSRQAFQELVRAVELSLFGGVPAGADEYERSLAQYRALVRRPA